TGRAFKEELLLCRAVALRVDVRDARVRGAARATFIANLEAPRRGEAVGVLARDHPNDARVGDLLETDHTVGALDPVGVAGHRLPEIYAEHSPRPRRGVVVVDCPPMRFARGGRRGVVR